MLTGHVDTLANSMLTGWAFNSASPNEHLTIVVQDGSRRVATGVANIVRPDLPKAGVGAGDHAFKIELPPDVRSLDGLIVIAQSVGNGERVLPGTAASGKAESASTAQDGRIAQLTEDLERLRRRLDGIEGEGGMIDDPDELAARLQRLESRMESAEVFFVRIDEMMHRLIEDKKKRRKRFLGLF